MSQINMGFLALLRNQIDLLELKGWRQKAGLCRSLLKRAELAVVRPSSLPPGAIDVLNREIRQVLGIRE